MGEEEEEMAGEKGEEARPLLPVMPGTATAWAGVWRVEGEGAEAVGARGGSLDEWRQGGTAITGPLLTGR